MKKKKNQAMISKNIKENQSYMEKRVGLGVSYDIGFRPFKIFDIDLHLYYLNGLVDDAIIVEIIKQLIKINDVEKHDRKKIFSIVENRLVSQQVTKTETMDEAVDQMLSGLIVIFIDGEKQSLVIDVRFYPGREPEEPDTERVVRGARDGYTENIQKNTALTRTRIRDERLRNEMMKVGERSKTDVCISYLQDVARDDLVKMVKEKVKKIEIDGIPMADKTVEEFIVEQKWNAFPLVRYTERPDIAAKHLMEGHVLLTVDATPSIIILPTTYFEHLEHAEEYRQSPIVGTYIRWVRLLAVSASIFVLPFWLLMTMHPELLPDALDFIGPKKEGNIPIVVQIILGVIGVEFLRMAAVHTPTPLATALGLIAAVLIGEIAVKVGLFTPEVILYVAISTVGSYVTPSYELSIANKLINFFLLLSTAFFGVPGFMVGTVICVLYLASIKAMSTPYLWPFIPFDLKAMIRVILRIPIPLENTRPTIVHPKNIRSQPLYEKQRNDK